MRISVILLYYLLLFAEPPIAYNLLKNRFNKTLRMHSNIIYFIKCNWINNWRNNCNYFHFQFMAFCGKYEYFLWCHIETVIYPSRCVIALIWIELYIYAVSLSWVQLWLSWNVMWEWLLRGITRKWKWFNLIYIDGNVKCHSTECFSSNFKAQMP